MNKAVTPATDIRIIKTAVCPSLSDRSSLSYNIGADAESGVHIQVFANSGKGFFNKDWIPLSAIQAVVNALPAGRSVVSSTFHALYAGKSSNNSGFLLAVLKHLGLVQSDEGYQRGYEFLDTTEFIAAMVVLMAELPPLEAIKKPAKTKGKKGNADQAANADQTANVDQAANADHPAAADSEAKPVDA